MPNGKNWQLIIARHSLLGAFIYFYNFPLNNVQGIKKSKILIINPQTVKK
jgi:hypothetical protein